jgi:N4-gp56 family major capsid protein
MSTQVYGDISPRTAAYAVKTMLVRGMPLLVLEKFGQVYVMPTKSSKTAKFRRYNALALATTPLVEGVTPTGKKQTVTDVTATLDQYGDFIEFSDVIEDTHEDPFLMSTSETLGEQAAQTIETIRWGILKGGSNVEYGNGASRLAVNTPISLTLQRRVTRTLLRQNAKQITSVVSSTPAYRTEPVEAAFVALAHVDLENDIRNMPGFIPVKSYGNPGSAYPGEIGAVDNVRYILTTLFTAFADAGGAKGLMISTTGTSADVYPIIYLGQNAYGIVPLKGKDSLSIMVVNPKPVHGDPLGQRGTAGWKTMQTAVILNDAFMVRAEVAATA